MATSLACPLVITTSWDDGSPFDLRLADLLAKYSLPATFYVPLRPDAPVLNRAGIQQLASRFEVGAHTVRHIPVTRLSLPEAAEEMTVSKAEIEQITGKPCPAFCFPQGKFRRGHLALAREAGFLACRTVAALSLAPPTFRDDILVMPTSVQVHTQKASALIRNLAKRRAAAESWNWLQCGLRRDWVDLSMALLDRAIQYGGVFHLWGHSWEIEEYGQWGRLEIFLRHLGGFRGRASYLTNSEVCQEIPEDGVLPGALRLVLPPTRHIFVAG